MTPNDHAALLDRLRRGVANVLTLDGWPHMARDVRTACDLIEQMQAQPDTTGGAV